MPGIPPGISAIKKANLNQNALIPKNSPKPPHMPAMTLLFRDRLKALRLPFT